MGNAYDVFISYSHVDTGWVNGRLLPELEARGFRVAIDYRDFQSGAFSDKEMERCIVQSNRTIAVLTPDYVRSGWAAFETSMVRVLDPDALHRRLVPVLVKDCEIPLRIRVMHYRDLRADDPIQWALLVRDLI